LLDNKLIKPFVFDDSLTGYTYEFFLRMSYQDHEVARIVRRHTVNDNGSGVLPTLWGSQTLHLACEGVFTQIFSIAAA